MPAATAGALGAAAGDGVQVRRAAVGHDIRRIHLALESPELVGGPAHQCSERVRERQQQMAVEHGNFGS